MTDMLLQALVSAALVLIPAAAAWAVSWLKSQQQHVENQGAIGGLKTAVDKCLNHQPINDRLDAIESRMATLEKHVEDLKPASRSSGPAKPGV